MSLRVASRARWACLFPGLLVAATAGAQNTPTATVSRTVFAGAEVVACRLGDTDPVLAEVSGNCTAALPGGTPTVNSAAGVASTSGVLRSRLELGLEGATPGTYALAPGASVQSFVLSQFQDRLLVAPLSGAPLPERVRLWLAIDGTLEEAFGLTTGNIGQSIVQSATWFAPNLNAGATSRILLGVDGSQVVDRPGATFVGTHSASTYTGGRSAIVDGLVGSHGFVVGADGSFDFAVFSGLAASVSNPTPSVVNIVGGAQRGDFFNTVRLVSAQAFDAQGRDVSGAYRFTTASGLVLAAGAPAVVPEPSTVALLTAGLLAIGVGAGARRSRAA